MSAAVSGMATFLKRGDGASPEVFTTIVEARSIKWNGRKLDVTETTNMDSTGNSREFLPTLFDAGEFDIEYNYIPTAATQVSLLSDYNARTLRNWKLVLPSPFGTWSFAGYVVQDEIGAEIDKQLMRNAKIKVTGLPTYV